MILNIEDLSDKMETLNSEETANDILNENENTEGYEASDFYNKRYNIHDYFKRFTLSIENQEAFKEWTNKAIESLDGFIRDNALKEMTPEEREILDTPDEKTDKQKKLELFEKLQKIANQKMIIKNELEELIYSISIDNWKEGKAPNGTKLNKLLRKKGMPQTFLDWSSTQEKSEKIIQITINPTIQAVAGMSNFAKAGSWNGWQGTSCQDTRQGGAYCTSLLGALGDDKYYTVQMNYIEDNDGLSDYLEELKEKPKGLQALQEALQGYNIDDNCRDILYCDNMQDNLKARVNARLWTLENLENESPIIKQYKENRLDFNFLKCITYYGSNKTKQELQNGLRQIADMINIVR